MRRLLFLTVVAGVVGLAGQLAMADPLTGEIIKFDQKPMVATIIGGPAGQVTYYGHDEKSHADYIGQIEGWDTYQGDSWMADDFADCVNSAVVHVRWWGSYIGVQPGTAGHITKFLIEWLSDQPAVGTEPSRPLALIQHEVVTKVAATPAPASGTFTEKWIRGPDPLLGENLFEYNCELKLPFPQKAHTVYWLKIVALDDTPNDYVWGWHNRDYTIQDTLACVPACGVNPGEHVAGVLPDGQLIWHFQDDAVKGSSILYKYNVTSGLSEIQQDLTAAVPQKYVDEVDGPYGIIGQYSKDLAFQLYYVPEPTTMVLLVLGGLGVLAVRFRRR